MFKLLLSLILGLNFLENVETLLSQKLVDLVRVEELLPVDERIHLGARALLCELLLRVH